MRKLRRAFRPTRAARSWHYAHALDICRRARAASGGFDRTKTTLVTNTWFISEYCADANLLTRWQAHAPTVDELHSLRCYV